MMTMPLLMTNVLSMRFDHAGALDADGGARELNFDVDDVCDCHGDLKEGQDCQHRVR